MPFSFHWVCSVQLGFTWLDSASFTQDRGSLSRAVERLRAASMSADHMG